MSECDLTPVTPCDVDPCVIGEPAPVASTCPSTDPTDPQHRLISLEQRNRALTASIRELQRLYNQLLNNTAAGSTTLQGQITALEAAMTATEVATAANAADIAANTASIAANAGLIATNTTDISTNAGLIAANTVDIGTNAADILVLQTNLANTDYVQAYISAPAASAAITSATYRNILENATIASSGFGANFTVDDVNKRITYTGATTKEFIVTCAVSFVSTITTEVSRFRLAENGAVDPDTEQARYIATGADEGEVYVQGIFTLDTNDYMELWATVDVSAADTITVENMTFQIHDLQPGI